MKEIEIKARLRNEKEVMKKLKALGCVFEKPMIQEDVVYVAKTGSLKTFLSNTAFLRIRVINGREVIFTVKRRTGALQAIEHEVEVNSKSELEGMISLMGYRKAALVKKRRVVTSHEGHEICIDEVDNLGSFIEMETLVKKGNPEKIQSKMFEFFKSLGISEEDRVFAGYDILMLSK